MDGPFNQKRQFDWLIVRYSWHRWRQTSTSSQAWNNSFDHF